MPKRRYKKKILPIQVGETAPKERQQHKGGLINEDIGSDSSGKAITIRQKAIAECVLDAYYIRELIGDPEYPAGMKFRHAYLRAVLRVKVADVGAGSHNDPEMSILTVMHSERLLKEAYAVLDMSEQAVIIAVCGHDDWAGGGYRMQILRCGLTKLAKLWKFSEFSL